jgi:hypothetical protein
MHTSFSTRALGNIPPSPEGSLHGCRLVGGKMLLHKPHSPHPCGLAMQDDKLLLRLLHSVRPVLQQLPRRPG